MATDPPQHAASAPELLHLTYRPDLGILIGRWAYQPDPAVLPAEYERLEAAALGCGAQRWLQDIRRRSLNDPQTSRWLLDAFFPTMARQLGGRLRVAYLASPSLYAHLVAEEMFVPVSGYADLPHKVAFFGDEGEAMAWLQSSW